MAQNLTLEPYYENNIFGNQFGGILSYELKKGAQFGIYYQSSLHPSQFESGSLYEFTGLYLGFRLYKAEKLSLGFSLRGGLVERRFVVVAPGIDTNFQLFKKVAVGTVISFRAGNPALGLKLKLAPF